MCLLLFRACRRGGPGLGGLVGRFLCHHRGLRMGLRWGGMWLWWNERVGMLGQSFGGRVVHRALHTLRVARKARGFWRIYSEG